MEQFLVRVGAAASRAAALPPLWPDAWVTRCHRTPAVRPCSLHSCLLFWQRRLHKHFVAKAGRDTGAGMAMQAGVGSTGLRSQTGVGRRWQGAEVWGGQRPLEQQGHRYLLKEQRSRQLQPELTWLYAKDWAPGGDGGGGGLGVSLAARGRWHCYCSEVGAWMPGECEGDGFPLVRLAPRWVGHLLRQGLVWARQWVRRRERWSQAGRDKAAARGATLKAGERCTCCGQPSDGQPLSKTVQSCLLWFVLEEVRGFIIYNLVHCNNE